MALLSEGVALYLDGVAEVSVLPWGACVGAWLAGPGLESGELHLAGQGADVYGESGIPVDAVLLGGVAP